LRSREPHDAVAHRRPAKRILLEPLVTHQGKQAIPSLPRSLSA
jgi:hypothetical protein